VRTWLGGNSDDEENDVEMSMFVSALIYAHTTANYGSRHVQAVIAHTKTFM
jgi:hypothetical protein